MPTEILYLLIGIFIGLCLYLVTRINSVPKSELEILKTRLSEVDTLYKIANDKLQSFNVQCETYKKSLSDKTSAYDLIIQEKASLVASVEKLEKFLSQINIELEREKTLNLQHQDQINHLTKISTDLNAQNKFLEDKLTTQKTEIEEFRRSSHIEFQNMANKIFDDKVSKFTQTNKENLDTILKPLGENLESFKKKVEETYDVESKQRFSLEERVKELMVQSNRISQEANNLTNALKGQAKKQGNWGEIILESILEKSGLVKNREYQIQVSLQNEHGQTLRPDVLIFLPDDRTIIVDSKVSLTAYDRYCAAESREEQTEHLKLHLESIYQHIDDLSKKRYDELTKGLDFTMMFIPIEPAYLLAIQEDQELWSYAYNKRILLISPTNLIAALKLITDLWKRDQQSKNAIEIAKQGERLYEKIVGFLESMEDVERHINRTQESFFKAKKQLKDGKGNIISQAVKLKNMGINSNKELPDTLLPNDIDDEDQS